MQPRKKPARKVWPLVVAGAVVLLAGGFGIYKYWFEAPTQLQIDEALNSRNWSRAASLIRRTDLKTDGGQNYFSLGVAYSNLGDRESAIEAFMGADDKRFKAAEARYAIAALYAAKDEPALALQWLKDAYDAGMTDLDSLFADKSLQKFRDSEEWRAVLQAGSSGKNASLDDLRFLIGTWSLTSALGNARQRATFASEFEGRAVSETWSGGGYDSSGLFVRDPVTRLWTYSYVDALGRTFVGTVRIGQQVSISGTLKYIDGTEYLRQIEIRSAGDVIDYTVTDSRDDGKTWDPPNTRRLSVLSDGPRPGF